MAMLMPGLKRLLYLLLLKCEESQSQPSSTPSYSIAVLARIASHCILCPETNIFYSQMLQLLLSITTQMKTSVVATVVFTETIKIMLCKLEVMQMSKENELIIKGHFLSQQFSLDNRSFLSYSLRVE